MNKIVEIQYFEESSDKEGNLSLRFPVFKQVRNDKNEESYE
jgi:DNA ligase-1